VSPSLSLSLVAVHVAVHVNDHVAVHDHVSVHDHDQRLRTIVTTWGASSRSSTS